MKKQGFSLMEMMIVLLITAIIAAATAPMVSKKMMRDAGAGNSPWLYAGLNGSIVYNPDGNTNKTAMIGAVDASKANNAKLYIESSTTEPQMAFMSSGNVMNMNVSNGGISISDNATQPPQGSVLIGQGVNPNGNANNSIALGSSANASKSYTVALGDKAAALGEHSVVIGDGATGSSSLTGTASNSIIIGSGAESRRKYTIAIGDQAIATGQNSIAIGRDASISESNAVVIGRSASAKNGNCVVIGREAVVAGANSVAVGSNTKAESKSVAIGEGAEALYTNSVAIGKDSKTSEKHQIVLGTSKDTVLVPGNLDLSKINGTITIGTTSATVYIPGQLIVDGTTELAKARGDVWGRFFGYGNYKYGKIGRTTGGHLYYDPSDRRLKNVGEVCSDGLNKIKQLKVYNYTFKNDPEKTPRVGVIAQDLQKVFPNAVMKGEDGFLRIRWEDMFYAMINAIKELDTKTGELRQQNKELLQTTAELKKENEQLEARIAKLEKQLSKIEK